MDESNYIARLKAAAEESLYIFGRQIIENDYLVPEVHSDLAKWLCDPKRKKSKRFQSINVQGSMSLILLPRDTLKTTFITTLYSLWRLIKNPNTRILIDSEARDLSMKILKGIKGLIDNSEWLKILWGDLNGSAKGLTWNLEEIRIATRTDFKAREDSIETAGIDVAITGRHYPLIIMDDLHSERNTKTKEQLDKVIDHIKYIMPMLETDGELIIIGTRWDDNDAYNWIQGLKDDSGELLFDCYIKSAYIDELKKVPYYSKRLPLEILNVKKIIMGDELFSAQYENDPVPFKTAIFKKSELKFKRLKDFPKDLNRFMSVDPIGDKEKARGDMFAATVWGIKPELNELGFCELYLIDGACGHFNIEEQLNNLVGLYSKTRPLELGIEKSGMATLHVHLTNMLKAKGIYMKITELKTDNRNKIERIKQFIPYFRQNLVVINEDINKDFMDEFINELIRFPKAKRRDILDASAYIFDFLEMYPLDIEEKMMPQTYHNYNSKDAWMGA